MSAELLQRGKGKSAWEMPSWPVITVWGGVAQRSDACGLPHEYGNAPKTPASLMHSSEKLRTVAGKGGESRVRQRLQCAVLQR